MTDPRAATIIDNLIVLLSRGEELPDYHAVEEGLLYLIETREEHPEHRITIRTFRELARRMTIRISRELAAKGLIA